jgi:hypothetical protein
MNKDNEMTGTTSNIINGIDKMEHREHVVIIYPNLYALREIYSHYCNIALKNNELVLILAYYQTAECIRLTLNELDIDVEKYEKDNLIKSHHRRIKVLPKVVGKDMPTTSILS